MDYLFFSLRVNVKYDDLFRDRAHFILFYRLRMKGSRIRVDILYGNVIFYNCFTWHLYYFKVGFYLVMEGSRRVGNVATQSNILSIRVVTRYFCNLKVLPRIMMNVS